MATVEGRGIEEDLRSRLRLLSMVPGLSVMVLLCATWALHVLAGTAVPLLVVGAGLGCGVVLLLSDRVAVAIAQDAGGRVGRELERRQRAQERLVQESLQRLESVVETGRTDLVAMVEQVERGEAPCLPRLDPAAGRTGHPFADLEHVLLQAQIEAMEAVVKVGAQRRKQVGLEAEAFVYVARRLHALVSQALAQLSVMENSWEDTELLDAVFKLDNLVTRTRRAVESIAVLGGEIARRVKKPLLLGHVLRQAVAEVEQFARVQLHVPRQEVVFPGPTMTQIVPLMDVSLPGYAGPDIIHLLAVLVENGANFSPPETTVWLRAEEIPAGLAFEIEDRGLSMSPGKLAQLNQLLVSPQHTDLHRQVRDGQIGLLVAARIAKRHGIHVQLRQNPRGGTLAKAVVPRALLVAPPEPAQPQANTRTSVAQSGTTGPVLAPGPLPAESPDGTAELRQQQPPTADVRKPLAPALPQRRRQTTGSPSTIRAAAAPDGDRPPLPRRREAHRAPDLPEPGPVPTPRRAVSSSPPTASLMARYRDGIRRGVNDTAAEEACSPGSAD
ncbi:ATP-binding protein [Streptomyces sp. NPDC101227]|uniref:sensor histidine kinase n=1 Tax=Streptomyces sp. NPDC101227 TaxID=3366136 RepID=UPI003825E706